jgi:5-methylcytosine-specific restriction endonuclease McrA
VSARDGGRCRQCGSTAQLHFDHVIPISRGGANTLANIQLLCGACNRAKGAKPKLAAARSQPLGGAQELACGVPLGGQ